MPTDPFAAPREVAEHPAVVAARRLGATVLEPHAEAADDPHRGVRRDHLDLLTEAGLAAVTVPIDDGGLGASRAVDLEVVELLAGACGATWFLLTQHELPQALVRASSTIVGAGTGTVGPAARRHRAWLCDGRSLAGVAVAHTRHAGPPAVRAEPDPRGGYALTGRAEWCTGWGLLDWVLVAGNTSDDEDEIVFGLIPAAERPGLTPTAPLPLAVMGGTRTVALDLDRCHVGADEVLLVVSRPAWLREGTARTANVRPAGVGLLRRVLAELDAVGAQRGTPAAADTAAALAARAGPLRAEAYALLDEPPHEHLDRRRALRAQLGELAVRAATALVAAGGGAAMLRTSPAQRWLREAAFHQLQAQNAAVRAAQLEALR